MSWGSLFQKWRQKKSLLGIKPFNNNKVLTGAERCNSFFPAPVGLGWFSLPLVRPVRNVWIRSFGAIPRTRFIWYQRILMCCQGPFCHWECRGWVCKGLAEPENKDKAPKQPILAGHLLSKATRDLYQKTPPKRRMSKGALQSWSWNIGCPGHVSAQKYEFFS